jgi:hypothetical protein
MNVALRTLVETAETWSQEDQDALVAYARQLEARNSGVYHLTGNEKIAVLEGLAQADADDVAGEEDVFSDLLPSR